MPASPDVPSASHSIVFAMKTGNPTCNGQLDLSTEKLVITWLFPPTTTRPINGPFKPTASTSPFSGTVRREASCIIRSPRLTCRSNG